MNTIMGGFKALFLISLCLIFIPSAYAWKMEVGTVTLPATSGRVGLYTFNFQQTYDSPPVVVALATRSGSQPSALRFENISTTSFDVAQVETRFKDGPHAAMTVSYIAVEQGVHTLPDGRIIEAGSESLSNLQFNYNNPNATQISEGLPSWNGISFTNTFSDTVLLAAIQTSVNEFGLVPVDPSTPWLTAAVDNITNTGADIALDKSQVHDRTVGSFDIFDALAFDEEIGYIAMDGNVGGTFTTHEGVPVTYEAIYATNAIDGWDNGGCNSINFSQSYGATPLVVATKSTRDADGGWLRECTRNTSQIQLEIDEDQAQDNERNQSAQDVSAMVFSSNFTYDSNFVPPAVSDSFLLEANSVTIAPNVFTRINFQQVYDLPPAVFVLDDDNNPEPSSSRIRNVDETGFDVIMTEPDSRISDAADQNTTLHFMVASYGDFQFPDGTQIQIKQLSNVSNFQGRYASGSESWRTVAFSSSFSSTPAVLGQIQTMENEVGALTSGDPSEPWLDITIRNVSTSQMDIALERAETNDGVITQDEVVAYLAIDPGIISDFRDNNGDTVSGEAQRTADSIAGTTSCRTINFLQSYSPSPLVIGTQNTRDGGDGGWLRRCSVSNSSVDLKIEEDFDRDTDRAHTTERAGIVVFSEPFAVDFSLQASYQLEGPTWNGSANEVVDSSNSGLDGVGVGNPSAQPGQVCYAANLNGSQYLEIPDDSRLDIQDELTVMAWINANTYPASDLMTIASKDSNYEYHLQPDGSVFWYWENGSGAQTLETAPGLVTLGGWHHVAIVYSESRAEQKIYVDGVEQASDTDSVSLNTNNLPFFIGVDYNFPSRAFDGRIDEVKVFSRALSQSAIQQFAAESRTCTSCILDDFDIAQTQYGLACPSTRAEVDILARCLGGGTKTDYAGTINLTAPAGAEFYESASGGPAVSSVTFDPIELGAKRLYLYFDDENPNVQVSVEDTLAAVSATAATGTDFRTSGFRVSTAPTNAVCGTDTAMTIQAFGQTDNAVGGACEVLSGFSGLKTMDVWFEATTNDDLLPDVVTTPLSMNSTNILQQDSSANDNLSLEFVAGEANISLNYANAANILGVYLRHDEAPYDGSEFSALLVSTASYVNYPETFELSARSGATSLNATTDSGSPTHVAASVFDLEISAMCAGSVAASDYQPTAASDRVMAYLQRTGPGDGPTFVGSVEGTLPISGARTLTSNTSATPTWVSADIAPAAFASGVYLYSSARYSEAGLVNLQVQDQNYFGEQVGPANVDIGRFIPSHFEVAVTDGALAPGCSPLTGTAFSYIGQEIAYLNPPSLTISARNADGDPTINYTQPGYQKLTTLDVSRTFPSADASTFGEDGLTAMALTSAALPPGTFSSASSGTLDYEFLNSDRYTFTKDNNAQIAPFIADLDIAITQIRDSDLVSANSAPYTLSPAGIELKYGRWFMDNVFGPETQALELRMKTQYWNGASFVTNTDDECTAYDAGNLVNVDSLGAGSTTPSGSGTLVEGVTPLGSGISLSAPGIGNTGTSDLEYQGDAWLQFDWDNDSLTNDTHATSTATFGQYRGHDRIIYWREVN